MAPMMIDGCSLDVQSWGDGVPDIVLLHDGLGSIAQWGDVPAAVHEVTGKTVLAYNRSGHGESSPVPGGAWPADWLHHEAEVFHHLLAEVGADRPLVVGHSDGGSIALIHEAVFGGAAATLTIAAHSWVEEKCADAIVEMRSRRDQFETGLAARHAHPAELFEAWSAVWVCDEFAAWDIRPLLGGIESPVVIAQGTDDEYASAAHVDETVAAIGPSAEGQMIEDGRHLLHYRDPQVVIDLIEGFVNRFG